MVVGQMMMVLDDISSMVEEQTMMVVKVGFYVILFYVLLCITLHISITEVEFDLPW